jgi:hypothetical protein
MWKEGKKKLLFKTCQYATIGEKVYKNLIKSYKMANMNKTRLVSILVFVQKMESR